VSNFNEISRLFDEGYTHAQIAAFTGIPIQTVTKELRRPAKGQPKDRTWVPEINEALFYEVK